MIVHMINQKYTSQMFSRPSVPLWCILNVLVGVLDGRTDSPAYRDVRTEEASKKYTET